MKIFKPGSLLAYDSDDIRYYELDTLGTPGDYTYRCKAELVREYYDAQYEKQRKISVKTNYCFGKNLHELQCNCELAIEKAWLARHRPCTARTYADVMYM